ncbi:hypothetical protein [Brevibacterium renqingii]|uniref:hypothetical protein n=1 Tax=Brevibacterium renqingii TaxID=2776916 RepID=UPI001AE0BD1B|nr:hypothetical protein [Brevibacterium renqingii]
MSAELGAESWDDLSVVDPVRMHPNITGAEALAVFQRKLPGAVAEVREVHHPFWWAPLRVRTRGLLRRESHGPGQEMNVFVNAVTGRAMIADFTPVGIVEAGEAWSTILDEHGGQSRLPSRSEAERTARALARAKVVKTVKLGMGIEISTADGHGLRGVLKPNWLVTGTNSKHSATILVDGLDSSHYIVRVEKLDRNGAALR